VPDGIFVDDHHEKQRRGTSKSRDRLVYLHIRGLKMKSEKISPLISNSSDVTSLDSTRSSEKTSDF
jgi:hypothetical protein